MPPEDIFLDSCTALPSGTKDMIALFERELAGQNGHTMTPSPSGFLGMMERDLKSVYDLLPMTPGTQTLSPIPNGATICKESATCCTSQRMGRQQEEA